jgi:hypothetical protein
VVWIDQRRVRRETVVILIHNKDIKGLEQGREVRNGEEGSKVKVLGKLVGNGVYWFRE